MTDIGSMLGSLGVGGNIGKAIVQLELDTAKYATEMEAAEAKTRTSTSSLGGSFKNLGGLASTALLGIGAAAVAGLGASVGAALEAEEAQQRLHNTIKNAPQLADSAEQAFLNQAEAIRKMTGADDEAIVTGQALLGQMGLTEDQILKLAPRVVDLSEKFGIDLDTAFKAVGKAATGSTGALSRYVGQIQAGETQAEDFANVLDKLGGSAGFAAEQAKNEPWRLLQSDLQELSEQIGTALLPTLRDLIDVLRPILDLAGALAPALHLVTEGFKFMLSPAAKVVSLFREGVQPTQEMVDLLGKAVAPSFEKVGDQAKVARQRIVNFAHLSDEELKTFAEDTKKSFGEFVLALDETTEHTKITRKEFRDAVHAMLENSRDLNQALRTLASEKWVNDEFVQFLSTQGPEWLVRFANLNKEQQRKFQDDWEASNRKLKDANSHFDTMLGLLGDLDSSKTKHTFEIHYEYTGFDPSKPGMSPQQK